jgi:nicotinate-nucleotide adenylyltransferase
MEVFEKYKEIVKSFLPEKRYKHSLLVADKAASLSAIWGADKNKAFVAGIFHDIMKYESEEKLLKLISDGGIILNASQMETSAVWHGYASAVYIRDSLGIKDEEIFDAIFYHSTGKEDMSVLTKIIYLADMISDDRVYKEADILRDLSVKDLDLAVKTALSMSIEFLEEKGKSLCIDTYKALKFLESKGV